MKTPDYIVQTLFGFKNWQGDIHNDVVTNAIAWNIPPAIVTQFTAMHTQYDIVFEPIRNDRTRTYQQVQAHDEFKRGYVQFLRALVQQHLVRNELISLDKRLAMGLNPRKAVYPEREKITTTPIIIISRLARAQFWFRFLVEGSSSRPKLHPDADAVELRYYFTDQPVIPGQTPPPPMATTTVDLYVSKRGSFIKDVGQDYIGKTLVLQARWVNMTDEKQSSTFSNYYTIVIS
jgi:hypothetical protein